MRVAVVTWGREEFPGSDSFEPYPHCTRRVPDDRIEMPAR